MFFSAIAGLRREAEGLLVYAATQRNGQFHQEPVDNHGEKPACRRNYWGALGFHRPEMGTDPHKVYSQYMVVCIGDEPLCCINLTLVCEYW